MPSARAALAFAGLIAGVAAIAIGESLVARFVRYAEGAPNG